ncbi:MAG: T9SS type A sorting domain-containing protein [Candidatus Kapabacteria bacterium]|nr:T9SS type A sorting domain-containing protein [Candidatus Kapabacteria bacterium]
MKILKILVIIFVICTTIEVFSQNNNKIIYTSVKGSTYVRDSSSKDFRVVKSGSDLNLAIPELTKSKQKNITYTNFNGETYELSDSKQPVKISQANSEEIYVIKNLGDNSYELELKLVPKNILFEIVNINGNVLLGVEAIPNHYKFDLKNSPEGIYFIKLNIDGRSFSQKIIIQK